MKTIFSHQSFRSVLKEEFERRSKRNPNYSLRAFARDLKLSPSRLIDVMNSRMGMSLANASEVSKKLNFNETEHDFFLDLVRSEHARKASDRNEAIQRVQFQRKIFGSCTQFDYDNICFFSNWIHIAIFECSKLPGFDGSAKWIAQQLGLPIGKIHQSLPLLERLKIVNIEKQKLVFVREHFAAIRDIPSKPLRQYHHQVLDLAHQQLDVIPLDKREYIAAVLPFDEKLIQKAKQQIRKAMVTFCDEHVVSPEARKIYMLALQFFPVSGETV